MKIRCEKEHLLSAVQIVQKATATKTTLPILTGILLAANEHTLELQATDYETGISMVIPAEVLSPGKIVLSGKFFPEIIRKINGESIEIASMTQGNMVVVSSGKVEFRVLSFPSEEFPNVKKLESQDSLVIKDDILKDLIKKTAFACSTDESRPLFTGALMEFKENELRLVATNTHRLALKKSPFEARLSDMKMIIPGKILTEVFRALSYEMPVDVKINWLKNQVSFEFENVYIMSRLIEGQFPDYRKVIPTEFTTYCTVPANILYDAVERVSLLAKDGDYNIVRMKFNSDSILLSGNNPDAGSASESLDIVLEGEAIEIAFNAKYMMDVLRQAGSGTIRFNLKSSLSPVMINLMEDPDYVYIITPIRTN